MLKLFSFLSVCITLPVAASGLTELESRWLQAGQPVIAFARAQGLPIDIIVQPQDAPGAVPLALGYAAGRCKLVLSLRGNAQAQSVLHGVASVRQDAMIEAMTAHEIGHCQRYAQGDWHVLPRGFVERQGKPSDRQQGKLARLEQELRATRREEAYADLVALAWMHGRHPGQYQDVLAWMRGVRAGGTAQGGSHATQAWLALAFDGAAFDGPGSPFEQAQVLWRQGLSSDK